MWVDPVYGINPHKRVLKWLICMHASVCMRSCIHTKQPVFRWTSIKDLLYWNAFATLWFPVPCRFSWIDDVRVQKRVLALPAPHWGPRTVRVVSGHIWPCAGGSSIIIVPFQKMSCFSDIVTFKGTSSLIKRRLFMKLDTWWYFTSPLLLNCLLLVNSHGWCLKTIDDPTTINIPGSNNLHPYPPQGATLEAQNAGKTYFSPHQPIVPWLSVPNPHVWHHPNHTMKRRTLTRHVRLIIHFVWMENLQEGHSICARPRPGFQHNLWLALIGNKLDPAPMSPSWEYTGGPVPVASGQANRYLTIPYHSTIVTCGMMIFAANSPAQPKQLEHISVAIPPFRAPSGQRIHQFSSSTLERSVLGWSPLILLRDLKHLLKSHSFSPERWVSEYKCGFPAIALGLEFHQLHLELTKPKNLTPNRREKPQITSKSPGFYLFSTWRLPKSWGYPQSSSIFQWDFPPNREYINIFRGVPLF